MPTPGATCPVIVNGHPCGERLQAIVHVLMQAPGDPGAPSNGWMARGVAHDEWCEFECATNPAHDDDAIRAAWYSEVEGTDEDTAESSTASVLYDAVKQLMDPPRAPTGAVIVIRPSPDARGGCPAVSVVEVTADVLRVAPPPEWYCAGTAENREMALDAAREWLDFLTAHAVDHAW